MRRALPLLAIALLAAPAATHARRAPDAGGVVTLALTKDLAAATREALTHAPLAELSDASQAPVARAAHPPIPGTRVWSRVLTGITPADDGSSWLLTPGSRALTRSLTSCLSAAEDAPWPGRALAAAGVPPTVTASGEGVTVRFPTSVSVLPELLTGCMLLAEDAATGAFAPDAGGFAGRADAPGGPPLLDRVVLQAVGRGSDGADLAVGAATTEGGSLLVAPWPDVLVLVFHDAAREADPLGLRDGRAGFQRDLAPDLLLAVRHGGRGGGATHLLPPGVAPDRAAGEGLAPGEAALELQQLGIEAPTFAIRAPQADLLAVDVADRLALLLRARGWAAAPSGPDAAGEIVRWRPPIDDPGLALLSLAHRLQLPVPPTDAVALLGGDRSSRTSAALTLERRWMDDRRAVPLLTASRWLVAHPRLRGVRLRGDGVPILDDAWWSAP